MYLRKKCSINITLHTCTSRLKHSTLTAFYKMQTGLSTHYTHPIKIHTVMD